ncbi:hypothetical protein PoB_005541400 [Plakobranchus ocellatus]|uniref:Uncharacterized protein n=1 Tax=Plakobranchus ocellatus TaxID=259542 RepID=A0AAV4C8M2_9GAST|nr:hypothetical protein PoB_005541400 [Plakobranchus ocellatus]
MGDFDAKVGDERVEHVVKPSGLETINNFALRQAGAPVGHRGTVDSESVLRYAGILLAQIRAPLWRFGLNPREKDPCRFRDGFVIDCTTVAPGEKKKKEGGIETM